MELAEWNKASFITHATFVGTRRIVSQYDQVILKTSYDSENYLSMYSTNVELLMCFVILTSVISLNF